MPDKETFKRAEFIRQFKLDPKRVKAAAALGLPGINTNNSIHAPTFLKSMEENAAAIDERMSDQVSVGDIKKKKLQIEVEIKELEAIRRQKELDVMDGKFIPIEQDRATFELVATIVSSHFIKLIRDLQDTCKGYEKVIGESGNIAMENIKKAVKNEAKRNIN